MGSGMSGPWGFLSCMGLRLPAPPAATAKPSEADAVRFAATNDAHGAAPSAVIAGKFDRRERSGVWCTWCTSQGINAL